MLSEDENKAIDILFKKEKIKLQSVLRIFKREGIENFVITRKEYLDIVSNLIEKLKKENEELKTEKQLLESQEKQLKNYIEELKKHDYRNIQIDEENEIKSISFTKEQLDLMNLGIALYIIISKLLEDESEDIDI